ncbi:MAG TPA: SAM-dependent methyltransferase [Natronosporangium sp.]|nr:SAM-dependent methyltransferase [Natronosporangium sp.]
MIRYALLVAPSANRVYAGQALRLTAAELTAFAERGLAGRVRDIAGIELAGVPYLGFAADEPLAEADLAYLSRVSTAYALFEVEGDRLRPVALPSSLRYDEDLITIPKYPGKTNEQFTQLLLNLTVLASSRADQMLTRRLVVLDPLCGRGTTLNVAMRYGYDAIGIEADGGHVDAYGAFLRTWLRRKRLKHRVEAHPVRQGGRRVARRLAATVAPSREAHRAGDVQQVTVYHADTISARAFLRAGCCDVMVADTPYGIAHGSRTPEAVRRDPRDLLAAAAPVWVELLRHGGALGVSFNTHLLTATDLADLLAGAGLEVVTSPAYQGFSHWVDQGITRDVVVARKP